MLLHLLNNSLDLKTLALLLNIVYYTCIWTGLLISALFIYRRLLQLGYEQKKVRLFMVLILVGLFPLGFTGARLINLLYFPVHLWTQEFIWEQLVNGKYIIFHGMIFLPVIYLLILIHAMKFKFWEVMDVIFMHISLGHAFGRLGCFLAGCCWGNNCRFYIGDFLVFGKNPVPLYELALNTALFFILQGQYKKFRASPDPARYNGLMMSGYLMIYGVYRFLLEFIRTEQAMLWWLTQAQVIMILYFIMGLLVLVIVLVRRGNIRTIRQKWTTTPPLSANQRVSAALAGFLMLHVVLVSTYITLETFGVISRPFHLVATLTESFSNLLRYIPVFVIALLSLVWLMYARLPFKDCLAWKNFDVRQLLCGKMHWSIYACFGCSIAYPLYVFIWNDFTFHPLYFIIPVILLSVLNAIAEEVYYRLVLTRLLEKTVPNIHIVVIVQGIVYALLHIYIGGTGLAALSLAYGIFMGYTFMQSRSIVPCVICHFCIDIGAIGLPMMIQKISVLSMLAAGLS